MSDIDPQDGPILLADGEQDTAAPVPPHSPRPAGRVGRAVRLVLLTVRWVFLPAAVAVTIITAALPPLGFRVMAITTGSMSPTIKPKDAVVVHTRGEPAPRVGDIIVFRNARVTEGMITHRVIATQTVDGEERYQTQGDANNTPDVELVRPSAVFGHVKFHIPRSGELLYKLTRPKGRLILLGPPIAAIMIEELLSMLAAFRTDRAARRANRNAKA
jgi:signal peptidase